VKYGWRGVATCAPIAVACVCLLTRSVPDFAVIQTQGFLAFAVTCLFIMGARIASQLHVAEREREALKAAMRVAQHCVHEADMRLRSTSQSLELVSGSMALIQGRVVERIKMFLPDADSQILLREASMTQNSLYRIAESLHPSAWRERGLPAALRETIGRAVDEIGVTYTCRIQGRGLSQLPMPIQQAIYRFAIEGVCFVGTKRRCQQIGLILRGGLRANGHRWAVLRIMAAGDPLIFDTPIAVHGHQSIASLLGAQGMGVEGIRDQVDLYGGTLHVKQAEGAFTLTILVHELSPLTLVEHTHPLGAARLWVH
jgi:signal transduction histidine kinase